MTARSGLFKSVGFDLKDFSHTNIDKDTADDCLQVIGAGLPRCGTTSLRAALEVLGFGPCHHMVDCFDYPERALLFSDLLKARKTTSDAPFDDPARLLALRKAMRGYKATVDEPCCDLYRELALLYPKAKVILSKRDTAEAWLHSVQNSIAIGFRPSFQFLVYPIGFLRKVSVLMNAHYALWMSYGVGMSPDIYHLHNAAVKRSIPPERLLEFNVKEGWGPLCKFLDVPVPDKPFPHLNDARVVRTAFFGAQVVGALIYLAGIAAVGGAVWLAVSPPASMRNFFVR